MSFKKIDFEAPYKLLVNGALEDGSGEPIKVYNPANNELLAEAPSASKEQVDRAINGAKKAFKTWKELTWDERAEYLVQFADALQEHELEFKQLLCREQGKPLATKAAECIDFTIDWIRDYSKLRLEPNILEDNDQHLVYTEYVPLGVVGMIMPWNFPFLLSLWQIAPALLVGCTVVLKPSSFTPLTSLRFGEIAAQVLPPGVLNVLAGSGKEVGDAIVESPDVAGIAFTGSIGTGKKIMASAADNFKRLTLELGGNDACVVLPDADLDKIIPTVAWAALGNSGQWCIAVKRIYVHSSIHDKFVKKLVGFVSKLKLGDGMDPDTDLAAINNKRQYEKLLDMLQDIKMNGYNIVYGGDVDESLEGNFIPVTVVDNPPEDSRIVQEEQFGPIIPVMSYETVEEAIDRANNTKFGLGASVFGEDRELVNKVAKKLEAGTVWANEIHIHDVNFPFGGIKNSGLGIENGIVGLEEYCDSKTYMIAK